MLRRLVVVVAFIVSIGCTPESPPARELEAGTSPPATGPAPEETENEPPPESVTEPASAPWVPPVECGVPLPGPSLSESLPEGMGGYASELATVRLDSVPDVLDLSQHSALQRTVINYMLGFSGRSRFSRSELEGSGPMGLAVLAAAAKGTDGRVNFAFLRRGLAHFYLCTRPLPATLSVLKTRYGDYRHWPETMLDCSAPKNTRRRLHIDVGQGVYVAETLNPDHTVRETEVLFTQLRQDGHLDFAVYTAEGALSNTSSFATARPEGTSASSPYACITCHLDRETETVSTLFPHGLGAGCR